MRNQSATRLTKFIREVRRYYRLHKRDLPWRKTRNPYHILVSEVMLQQTQVARVIPKYRSFIRRFPDIHALSEASHREVLLIWQGLGYNRRALALKKASQIAISRWNSRLPHTPETLEGLPGVGQATAGAIAAFAFNAPAVFIETNIRRAFLHFFFRRRRSVSDAEITALLRRTLEKQDPRNWYWALMDYGAMLGLRRRDLGLNPNRRSAHYQRQSSFHGSDRQLRGKILAYLLLHRRSAVRKLCVYAMESLEATPRRVKKILAALARDGFLKIQGQRVYVVSGT